MPSDVTLLLPELPHDLKRVLDTASMLAIYQRRYVVRETDVLMAACLVDRRTLQSVANRLNVDLDFEKLEHAAHAAFPDAPVATWSAMPLDGWLADWVRAALADLDNGVEQLLAAMLLLPSRSVRRWLRCSAKESCDSSARLLVSTDGEDFGQGVSASKPVGSASNNEGIPLAVIQSR